MKSERETLAPAPATERASAAGVLVTKPRGKDLSYWLGWARSYFFCFPLICGYTGILGTASMLVSRFDRGGRKQHALATLWAKLILGTCFSPVEIIGREKLDSSRSRVYCVNHISAMDIPVVYSSLPFQFRILAKIELFSVPFIGGHLRRSGQLPVDQSHARASVRTLNAAVETVKSGMPVLIFPEGGRSATGQVTPFMSGPFYIAIRAQAEIVPMAIVNSFEMLPMNTYHVHPQKLKLIVGDPISPSGYGPKDTGKLAEKVQQAIEDMYYRASRVRKVQAPADDGR